MYLPLRSTLHRPAKRVLADKLEVFRRGVHLCTFHVGDDDKYVVATVVVHPAQEHKFRQLYASLPFRLRCEQY